MSKGTVNMVIIMGNLGKDPVVSYTPDGKAVANFTVATTEVWGKGDEKKERTEWHRIVAFRRLAEIVDEYVKSGHKVYIQGRLQTRKYQAKDGSDRYITEIVADSLEMLGGGKGAVERPKPQQAMCAVETDDLPFDDALPF